MGETFTAGGLFRICTEKADVPSDSRGSDYGQDAEEKRAESGGYLYVLQILAETGSLLTGNVL